MPDWRDLPDADKPGIDDAFEIVGQHIEAVGDPEKLWNLFDALQGQLYELLFERKEEK